MSQATFLLLVLFAVSCAVNGQALRGVLINKGPRKDEKKTPVRDPQLSYVGANKFSTPDCSGSSTLVGLVQNVCVPDLDISQSPPKLMGYRIWWSGSAGGTSVSSKLFPLSDATCSGTAVKSEVLVSGHCYSISSTLSWTFNAGTVSTDLAKDLHGLFYTSFSSADACANFDGKSSRGVIAAAQMSSSYQVPAALWGQTIKLTCAAPDTVEIVQTSGNPQTFKMQLGACTQEAPGGYYVALRCYK